MGYHDRRELPNYWAYADNFVLQDRMFESAATWSLPAHLFIISGWSARCSSSDPMSCVNELQAPDRLLLDKNGTPTAVPTYAWTDITYLLHENRVILGILPGRGHPAGLRQRCDVLRGAAPEG